MIDMECIVSTITKSQDIATSMDDMGHETDIDSWNGTTRLELVGLGVNVQVRFYEDCPARLNDKWRVRIEKIEKKGGTK